MNSAAGVIDELIGAGLPQEVKDMTALLGQLRAEYNATVKDIASGMATLQKSTGVKGVSTSIDGITTSTRKIVDLQTEIEKVTQKIVQMSGEEAKSLAELKQKLNEITTANREYAKSQAAPTGSIDAMKLKLKELETQINRVADAEGKGADQVKKLEAEYNKLDATVRKHQQNIGNFSKSVGNYEKGFNGMSLAISQIAREMPNFAQSVQIGVMSLTNNIGGLTDAYKLLVAQNKALQAAGQPTVSIATQIWQAVKSWNTVIMIAVTLITALTPKIMEWVNSLVLGKEALDRAAKSQEIFLSAFQSTEFKNAVKIVDELRINIDLAKKGILDKTQVTEQYNKVLGDTFGNASNLDEAEQNLIKNGQAYVDMTLLKAAANLALDKAAEKYIEAEVERRKRLNEINPEQGQYGGFLGDMKALWEGIPLEEAAVGVVNKFVSGIKKEGDDFKDIAKEFQQSAAELAKGMGANFLGKSGADQTKAGKTLKGRTPKEARTEEAREFVSDLNRLDRQIYLMDEELDEKLYRNLQKRLEKELEAKRRAAQQELELIKANLAAMENMEGNKKLTREGYQELKANADATLQAVTSINSLMLEINGIIMQQINTRYDKELDGINRVEKAELEALDRKTMSAAKREEEKKRIELEAEARRKKTEQERIKDLRKYAIFKKSVDSANIIGATALAIMGYQYDPGGYPGLALSIAAAAQGAAQLAAVLATPIPQYAGGRNGGPAEIAEVNERGPEVIENKDGRMWVANKGKRGLTFLPEGAKVHPHERIKNAAFMQLAKTNGPVTEDSYTEALLQAYIEGTNKVEKAIKQQKKPLVKVIYDSNYSKRLATRIM